MASQRQTSSSSFLFSPFMTPLASAHNFAHMQETGFGNLVICRGNRQMLYPSLCVFTFQIPPMCSSGIICYVSKDSDTSHLPRAEEWTTLHIQKEQSHWTIAPLLWQKRGNNRSTGRLFLSTLEVIDSATNLSTSWHDTPLYKLVSYVTWLSFNLPDYHFHSTAYGKGSHDDSTSDEYLRDYAQVINMRSKEGDCSRPLQE